MVPVATKMAIGKIVVPATWDNKPVLSISGFNHQTGITHIFFEDEHPLRFIAPYCC
jgi:hypothetical protein